MSEFTHDTAEDGFHEIQLSGKQLVFLFIVTTTVIVVVFLCGVKVGRGARAAQGDEPEPSALSATVSPDQQPVPQTVEPRPTEPPPPPAEEADKLTYSEVLKGKATDVPLKPEADVKAAPAPAPAAAEPKPKAVAPAPAPAAPEKPDTAGVPTAGRPGAWAIQVIATRDRNMATSIVKRLGGKGYPAFLVNPPAGKDPGFYKVHVGRYKDRGEAERVSQRIKKEEQFQSWITR